MSNTELICHYCGGVVARTHESCEPWESLMCLPCDQELLALADKAARAQYALLEEKLLRVFGSKDAAAFAARDLPLSLCQTPEGNLRGELPTLCLLLTCCRCGAEQAGPAIWTPEDLQNSKGMRGTWKCCDCR